MFNSTKPLVLTRECLIDITTSSQFYVCVNTDSDAIFIAKMTEYQQPYVPAPRLSTAYPVGVRQIFGKVKLIPDLS